MNCCSLQGTDRCFSKNAAKYEKRFRNGGLDLAQHLILKVLNPTGLRGKTILDIGCGVGNLHLMLLRAGAGAAVGVDISEGMIHWSFRSYYHQPAMLHRAITSEGFNQVYSAATWVWQVRIYRRVS